MTQGSPPAATKRDTMVLVHGGGGWAKEMLPIAEAIEPRMKCVGLNLLGHGGRPLPDGYSIDDMADDLAENIVSAGLNKPFVFAYCMGGLITLNLLTRHPGLFSAAILLAPRYRFSEEAIDHALYLITDERLARPDMPLTKSFKEAHGPLWKGVVANNRKLMDSFRRKPPVDESLFSSIECPVMVIGPTSDPLMTSEESRILAEQIPRSRLAVLQGSAHPLSMIPFDNVADAAVDFCLDVKNGRK